MKYVRFIPDISQVPAASIFSCPCWVFMYLLLFFKVDAWLAIAGALPMDFQHTSFFILGAGHNTKALAIAYMAPMIGGIYYSYRNNAIKGALFTTFFLTLEILANHPQITYYSFICILVFIIAEFIFAVRKKEITAIHKNFSDPA